MEGCTRATLRVKLRHIETWTEATAQSHPNMTNSWPTPS